MHILRGNMVQITQIDTDRARLEDNLLTSPGHTRDNITTLFLPVRRFPAQKNPTPTAKYSYPYQFFFFKGWIASLESGRIRSG